MFKDILNKDFYNPTPEDCKNHFNRACEITIKKIDETNLTVWI